MTTAETQPDWAARWRAIYERRAEQLARILRPEEDRWGGMAEVFSRQIDAPDPIRDLILSWIEPEDTVLDVGAGAGRYAIPFARKAREVIAVEPSAGMGQALTVEAARRGVDTIRLVQSDWLSAEVPSADVVVCAHVLYFTPEVEPFVRRLEAHARRLCVIVIRVDQRAAGFAPLFEEIWGEPDTPEPSFIDLYNVLYSMGIAADVTIRRAGGGPGHFRRLEDAEAMAIRSIAPPNDAARAKIRPFLEATLRPTPDGALTFPQGSPRVAAVSWRPG